MFVKMLKNDSAKTRRCIRGAIFDLLDYCLKAIQRCTEF